MGGAGAPRKCAAHGQLYLLRNGWMHPTDATTKSRSARIAIRRPTPAVEVPDASGSG